MNHLSAISSYKNTYWAMRHGESLANHERLIISDPEIGRHGFGLTSKGENQIRECAQSALKKGLLDMNVVIFTSDFERCLQSAKIAAKILGTAQVVTRKELQERFFGKLDGTGDKSYQKIWRLDAKGGDDCLNFEVETVKSVEHRMTSLIKELESRYFGKVILLVSHGDPLKILETSFQGKPAHTHRNREELPNAQLRRLK
jgi:broad specificity phosphatase PhoE